MMMLIAGCRRSRFPYSRFRATSVTVPSCPVCGVLLSRGGVNDISTGGRRNLTSYQYSKQATQKKLYYLRASKRHAWGIAKQQTTTGVRDFSSHNETLGDTREIIDRDDLTLKISFLTDVEGDGAYLDRFVENSEILKFQTVTPQWDRTVPGSFFPYDKEIVFQEPDSILVYGGDLWDKGGSDLYVIRQLLSLRARYHERVQFLMGNRDINKMRILEELGVPTTDVNCEPCPLPFHPGVWWFKGSGRPGDPDLCTTRNNDQYEYSSVDGTVLEEALPESSVPSSSAGERLKWMLSQTMGSPDAFEFRRSELQWERCQQYGAQAIMEVTDEDVAESYRQSCHPTRGEMGQYLSQAKIALRFGNALFVHGALPLTPDILAHMTSIQNSSSMTGSTSADSNLWSDSLFDRCMPWKQTRNSNKVITTANEFIDELNRFAKRSIHAWKRRIAIEEERSSLHQDNTSQKIWSIAGGYPCAGPNGCVENDYESLLQYGMGWIPGKGRNPTIVYFSWLTEGMPKHFFPDNAEHDDNKSVTYAKAVQAFFEISNLQLIVSGHQPVGDMPLPIHVNNLRGKDSQWIFACDTSYSADTRWVHPTVALEGSEHIMKQNLGRGRARSGRGENAVSELIISQNIQSGHISQASCHGVLSDGSNYSTQNFMGDSEVEYSHISVGEPALFDVPLVLEDKEDENLSIQKWWVKAKFQDGSALLYTGKGFNVCNTMIAAK